MKNKIFLFIIFSLIHTNFFNSVELEDPKLTLINNNFLRTQSPIHPIAMQLKNSHGSSQYVDISKEDSDKLQSVFINNWKLMEFSEYISKMLIHIITHNPNNPKKMIEKTIADYIKDRNMKDGNLFEDYKISKITEVRDKQYITGFTLIISKNNIAEYELFYGCQNGKIVLNIFKLNNENGHKKSGLKRAVKLPLHTKDTLRTLKNFRGNQRKAAAYLNISRQAMNQRIENIRKSAEELNNEYILKYLTKLNLRKNLKISSCAEDTLKALEDTGGNRAKAAEILGLSNASALSSRIKTLRKSSAEKSTSEDTLKRIDRALTHEIKLPAYTKETLKILKYCKGDRAKAAKIFKISRSAVNLRIKSIKYAAIKLKDENILRDLASLDLRQSLNVDSYREDTLNALEKSKGNLSKAAKILKLSSGSAVMVRIETIGETAMEKKDITTLKRLDTSLENTSLKIRETMEALKRSNGNQTKAAEILRLSNASAVNSRIAAIKSDDTVTLQRLDEALIKHHIESMPSDTEMILSTLEESGGNQEKAANIIKTTQGNISKKIKAIGDTAIQLNDIVTLSRLNRLYPKKFNTPVNIYTEREHSMDFQDNMDYFKNKTIFALGTSCINGYQRDGRSFKHKQGKDLNKLFTSISNYCSAKGITFIFDEDNNLLSRINDEKCKDGMSKAEVIVLAGKDIATSKEFFNIRVKDPYFFAIGIDNKNLSPDNYICIMEMLNITLRLYSWDDTLKRFKTSQFVSVSMDRGSGVYILTPEILPVELNYEAIKAIYDQQRFA